MSPVQPPDAGPAAAGRAAHDDGATFSGAISGQRGRPPMVLVAFIVVISALVVVGIGGQQVGVASGSPGPGTAAAAATPSAEAARAEATAEPLTPIPAVSFMPAQAPIVASAAGSDLALTIRRHPESLFVHGDVYPSGVTWVFVNVLDVDGRVAAWHQVSIPGGAGTPPEGRPSMRFDVELAFPPWATGPLWVQAVAYDGSGSVAAQERLGVWPDGEPMSLTGEWSVVPADEVMRLDSPAAGGPAVTERAITVTGTLLIRADTVEISILTADRRLLSSRTVETRDPDGGIRPRSSPTIEVRLGIPDPRPTGVSTWIVITALDEAGATVGFQRWPVAVGPLASDEGAAAPSG
jgi:hypothetical protein